MKIISKIIITGFLFSVFFILDSQAKDTLSNSTIRPNIEQIFDSNKWKVKQGKDYPYRDKMLNDILYTDTFRKLNKTELLIELGNPSYYREDKSYLHYIITQKRLFFWPLHTKVLVIKLKDDETVEWIKLHE